MPRKKKVQVEGLGDQISKITKFLGIPECDACKTRKDILNRLFPTKTALEMEADELRRFAEVKDKRVLNNDELTFIQALYFKTFQLRPSVLCRACPQIWIDIIQRLTQVYNVQTYGEETKKE